MAIDAVGGERGAVPGADKCDPRRRHAGEIWNARGQHRGDGVPVGPARDQGHEREQVPQDAISLAGDGALHLAGGLVNQWFTAMAKTAAESTALRLRPPSRRRRCGARGRRRSSSRRRRAVRDPSVACDVARAVPPFVTVVETVVPPSVASSPNTSHMAGLTDESASRKDAALGCCMTLLNVVERSTPSPPGRMNRPRPPGR